ncbi:MAG: Uma2 family endonuclease [Firmicutes bacterium]|nr:Uma2 family endonuclease [Bacillota bacterium]
MDLEQMKKRKRELGYTNKRLADLADVPLSTIQKIFSGKTTRPQAQTMARLENVLREWKPDSDAIRVSTASEPYYYYRLPKTEETRLREIAFSYGAAKEIDLPRGKKQGEYTVEDFFAMPEDWKGELIDGVIYDMTTPTLRHQAILGQIHYRFLDYQKKSGKDCMVYLPLDVQLDKDNRTMVEPDMLVICHQEYKNHAVWGAPDFVMEVLSPSTSSRDCILKLKKYRDAGVKEYWIVDGERQKVFVYDFTEPENQAPYAYTFEDQVPVRISGGELVIDFAEIKAELLPVL